MAATKEKKVGVFRWRGVLGDLRPRLRAFIFFVLFTANATLTFTALGFGFLNLPGIDDVYVVALLLPLVGATLLLGTWNALLFGLLTGVLMSLHAWLMPLNVYEMAFITPITSIAMFSALGLFLGISFALALRGNPGAPRRFVYMALICFIGSVLYSLGFAVNAFIALIIDMILNGIIAEGASEEVLEAIVTYHVGKAAFRLGNTELQMLIDWLLMSAACVVVDIGARKLLADHTRMSVRGIFNVWLSLAVVLVFMASSAATYVAVTVNKRDEAAKSMETMASYIDAQMEENLDRRDMLGRFLEGVNVDIENVPYDTYRYYQDSILKLGVLEGYTEADDGIIFVTSGQMILTSDIPGVDEDAVESVSDEIYAAMERSLQSGRLQRIIYDGSILDEELGIESAAAHLQNSELAYLYSTKATANSTITIIKPSSMVFADRKYAIGSAVLSLVGLLLVVYSMVAFLLSRLVARRIDETNTALGRIAEGDLDVRVEVKDPREFDSLSKGINATVDAMQNLISEAENRMAAELATAKAIQESALPSTFPPYPDIMRFDIYASMNAAKQVGGDFYDFFLLGDSDAGSGKLCFVVADVSGKGVPAALFMMEAKSQLRNYVLSGMELGEAVENANRQLCEGNGAGMFVTAWVGVLDYATGHVDYVNAGHNPPLLWAFDQAKEPVGEAGSWTWLRQRSGLPLGMFDTAQYRAHSVDCTIGDQFLLYSDGVTEAMDVDGKLYGEDRLMELVGENSTLHPRMLVNAVRKDVAAHAIGAEQSDDITILSLEVGVPPELTATITVPADASQLSRVNAFIHTELDRRLCPLRVQNKLDIAVEELFVNVCRYAYLDSVDGEPGLVRVNYTYGNEPPSVTVSIADDGMPFNPLEVPEAQTPDAIENVPIGGLGLLMARRSVDEMYYERVGSSNIVTIVKRW